MEQIRTIDTVFFPPIGIAHITQNIANLFEHLIPGKQIIIVKTSSQPNSNPHLGTVMTMMTGFALSKYLGDYFSLPSLFLFDSLENSPAETVEFGGSVYQRSLGDTIENGEALSEKYLLTFKNILNSISGLSGVPYRLRTYSEFQSISFVRKAILQILLNEERFIPLFSPSEKKIRVRFPCPVCKLSNKSADTIYIDEIQDDSIRLTSKCYQHGNHSIRLGEKTKDFVDANTPIRDVTQGVLSIEGELPHSLTIMLDGGDWSGVWALQVFCRGLIELGYNSIPPRLFAPVILDWSGAKFSKSLYLQSDAYQYLPIGLVDFSQFNNTYGDEGWHRLWSEAQKWVGNPKMFFRNYSVDYFRLILEQAR